MTPETGAEIMRVYASDAVKYAHETHGISLDYSEQSLLNIDRLIDKLTPVGVFEPSKLTPSENENRWTFSKMLGGYVGEVIIRNIGGEWFTKDLGDGSSSIHLRVAGGLEGSPPQAVWNALTDRHKGIATYYRTLMAAMGRGESVTREGETTVKLPPFSSTPPASHPAIKPLSLTAKAARWFLRIGRRRGR